MKRNPSQSGMSLTEMLVVTAAVAVLLAISVPAAKKVMESFDSSAGARALINAALSSARAMAMAQENGSGYAGVRFQQDRKGDFYMIFIIHDPNSTGLANGFRAVKGKKPIRLPLNVGLFDGSVNSNDDLYQATNIMNAQTFSIVFSSSGRLVRHPVRIWNRDGVYDDSSTDSIFNTYNNVNAEPPIGMFYQDNYALDPLNLGLMQENSTHALYLYDKRVFEKYRDGDSTYTNYVRNLSKEVVSPYTGELIKQYEGQF